MFLLLLPFLQYLNNSWQFPEALRYQVILKVAKVLKKTSKWMFYYCFITKCKCDHRRLAYTEEYWGRTWFAAAFSVSHVNTRPGKCRESSHPAADGFPSARCSLLPLFWCHKAPESAFFSIGTATTEAHMMRKGTIRKIFFKKWGDIEWLITTITQDCKTSHTSWCNSGEFGLSLTVSSALL